MQARHWQRVLDKLQPMFKKKDLGMHLALKKKVYMFSWVEESSLSDDINALINTICVITDI